MVPYPSMLDVPYELVEHVSWLVYTRRRELRSPWRKLSCFKQALLTLAHLRKNETFAQVGAGFGVSEATAWRYVDERLEVLAAWAPDLHEALVGLGEGDFVIVDGPLIPTDRIQFNRDHARLRAPGERAFAQLKSWRLLRRARCSTRRIGTAVQAIHTLLTCSYSG